MLGPPLLLEDDAVSRTKETTRLASLRSRGTQPYPPSLFVPPATPLIDRIRNGVSSPMLPTPIHGRGGAPHSKASLRSLMEWGDAA